MVLAVLVGGRNVTVVDYDGQGAMHLRPILFLRCDHSLASADPKSALSRSVVLDLVFAAHHIAEPLIRLFTHRLGKVMPGLRIDKMHITRFFDLTIQFDDRF